MKMKYALVGIAALAVMSGCTQIQTGHVGVRTTFNGTIEPKELDVGYHQVLVGSVKSYVANEMTMQLNDLHPQTKDRSTLKDLDLQYTYSVDPGAISDLAVKYKGRDWTPPNEHDIYPLGLYVNNVVMTAAGDVISQYDALQANENREEIRAAIRVQVQKIFKEEGIEGKVKLHQVFIKNLLIADSLQASALAVINAQNDFKTKEFEVKTAGKEAERLTLLANNAKNIDYMNAKSLSDIAQAVLLGKVSTIVVPYDFKGMINVHPK